MEFREETCYAGRKMAAKERREEGDPLMEKWR